MKTNIRMKVTPEQSRKVQEICFKNNITWNGLKALDHLREPFLYIHESTLGYDSKISEYFFNSHYNEEIDADLFIRTNGTCEEINSSIDYETLRVSHIVLNSKYEELEQKLKKKNEILKKARIKRKNQREELHKLNLKLQKSISLEEHKEITNDAYIRNRQLEDNFRELRKLGNLNKSDLDLAMTTVQQQNKKIEKLKAVIEYLESKIK